MESCPIRGNPTATWNYFFFYFFKAIILKCRHNLVTDITVKGEAVEFRI